MMDRYSYHGLYHAGYANQGYGSGYGFHYRSVYDYDYSRYGYLTHPGYGTPVIYQHELVPPAYYPGFLSPRRCINPNQHAPPQTPVYYPRFLSPRQCINPNQHAPAQRWCKRRQNPASSLSVKKKPLKKAQKAQRVFHIEPKENPCKPTPSHKEQKGAAINQKSQAVALVKKTMDLHKLCRTGLDVTPKQAASSEGKNIRPGQKRKAEVLKKGTPSKNKRNRKKKKFATEKKKIMTTSQETNKDDELVEPPKVANVEPTVLINEEKKKALEHESTTCNDLSEVLEIAKKSVELEHEAEKSVPTDARNGAQEDIPTMGTQEDNLTRGAQENSEVAQLRPTQEEKELEEKEFNFFSKIFKENSDLRKLYLDKEDARTFECLVCCSDDSKTRKKFTNLTNLVRHTCMKKEKRFEHLGYGKAICDILGWEPLRPNCPAKQRPRQPTMLRYWSHGGLTPEFLAAFWRHLRSSCGAHRIAYFMWMVARRGLTVQTSAGHAGYDSKCSRCEAGSTETIKHALWSCPHASAVWPAISLLLSRAGLDTGYVAWGTICWLHHLPGSHLHYEGDADDDIYLLNPGGYSRSSMYMLHMVDADSASYGRDQRFSLIVSISAWCIWKARCTHVMGGEILLTSTVLSTIWLEIIHTLRRIWDSCLGSSSEAEEQRQAFMQCWGLESVFFILHSSQPAWIYSPPQWFLTHLLGHPPC